VTQPNRAPIVHRFEVATGVAPMADSQIRQFNACAAPVVRSTAASYECQCGLQFLAPVSTTVDARTATRSKPGSARIQPASTADCRLAY